MDNVRHSRRTCGFSQSAGGVKSTRCLTAYMTATINVTMKSIVKSRFAGLVEYLDDNILHMWSMTTQKRSVKSSPWRSFVLSILLVKNQRVIHTVSGSKHFLKYGSHFSMWTPACNLQGTRPREHEILGSSLGVDERGINQYNDQRLPEIWKSASPAPSTPPLLAYIRISSLRKLCKTAIKILNVFSYR